MKEQSKADLETGMKVLSVIILVFALFKMCSGGNDESETTKEKELTEKHVEETKPKQTPKQELEFYIDAIKSHKLKESYSSNEELMLEATFLNTIAGSCNSLDTISDPEVKALNKSLRKELVKLQVKTFPILRNAWLSIHKHTLWENNIKVKKISSTSIMFISGAFANNRNIQEMHSGISEMMSFLRFKRASYKWADIDTEYTYYDIESEKDSDI